MSDLYRQRWPLKIGQGDKLSPAWIGTGTDGQGYEETIFG
jgi:hypothetical protein